ncbi:ice-binding family protein, partial [Cellulomonas citrea]|uniref:ice-binding family protein n=1 Tax=Cellulomonas citrea TaxID=1909423 RepID=UPI001916B997
MAAVAAAGLLVAVAGPAQAATPVGLGTATSFVVLAGAGVTNTGPTTLNGDVGTFPTTSISGAGSLTVTGTVHAGDAVTQDAKTDLVTAYDVAAGQASNVTVSADLAGQTLVSGVYTSASTMGLSGALTLDAAGDPDAVFVFQVGSALTVGNGASVLLTNGAQACNVIWQVGSSATVGTGAQFRGTVLALTDITLATGATAEGRLLARNGAVTLDTNVVTRPSCTTPTGGTSTTTAQDAAARDAAAQAAADQAAA